MTTILYAYNIPQQGLSCFVLFSPPQFLYSHSFLFLSALLRIIVLDIFGQSPGFLQMSCLFTSAYTPAGSLAHKFSSSSVALRALKVENIYSATWSLFKHGYPGRLKQSKYQNTPKFLLKTEWCCIKWYWLLHDKQKYKVTCFKLLANERQRLALNQRVKYFENKENLLVIKTKEVVVTGTRHKRGMTTNLQLLQIKSTSILKYRTWHRHIKA